MIAAHAQALPKPESVATARQDTSMLACSKNLALHNALFIS
jgi:hypothetical protein